MPKNFVAAGAIIGSTLMALSLTGSYRNPANLSKLSDRKSPTALLATEERLYAVGKSAFSAGRYREARDAFRAAAVEAVRVGQPHQAAMNWSNAGFVSVTAMQYKPALEDLTRARKIAEASGEMSALSYALNNLASLYLQMAAPGKALAISREALAGPARYTDASMRGKLLYQEARSLAELGRFQEEAEPLYRQAVQQMMDAGDLDATARGWASLGSAYLDVGNLDRADWALSESLRLVRTHHLKAAAYALTSLGKLRGKQGDRKAAETLFQAALNAHESVTPLWVIYYERGLFRLEAGNNRQALDDFREARSLAMRMRADIVPVDQSRVSLENYMSRILEGLVEAGNRLAISGNDKALLAETFDVAEQDRLWSLRLLVPEANDWRSRLNAQYWELLVRFQSAERSLLAQPSPEAQKKATELDFQLQQAEAAAGAGKRSATDLPSKHVKDVLDPDSVLLSFSITGKGSWLWILDCRQTSVYALPSRDRLKQEVDDYTRALHKGGDAAEPGRKLYGTLFGAVPAAVLAHKRWLLEPDGPLYDLPFAALPADTHGGGARPVYLIERAALQTIPGVLLMERGSVRADGAFVGIGDPIFNGADARYHGGPAKERRNAAVLPRLPNTAAEVEACARAWGSDSPQLLIGSSASVGRVESVMASSPAVIHFATHVVTAPNSSNDYGSGLIALSLDAQGGIGLMGPKDIAARRVGGSIVVMDGCHSAQGEALPGSGLMGLTRAWIGAGARAVLATRWDVPDETAESVMVNFYRSLSRESPHGSPAAALRDAQLAALRSEGPDRQPLHWAGYFLLSRI